MDTQALAPTAIPVRRWGDARRIGRLASNRRCLFSPLRGKVDAAADQLQLRRANGNYATSKLVPSVTKRGPR